MVGSVDHTAVGRSLQVRLHDGRRRVTVTAVIAGPHPQAEAET